MCEVSHWSRLWFSPKLLFSRQIRDHVCGLHDLCPLLWSVSTWRDEGAESWAPSQTPLICYREQTNTVDINFTHKLGVSGRRTSSKKGKGDEKTLKTWSCPNGAFVRSRRRSRNWIGKKNMNKQNIRHPNVSYCIRDPSLLGSARPPPCSLSPFLSGT